MKYGWHCCTTSNKSHFLIIEYSTGLRYTCYHQTALTETETLICEHDLGNYFPNDNLWNSRARITRLIKLSSVYVCFRRVCFVNLIRGCVYTQEFNLGISLKLKSVISEFSTREQKCRCHHPYPNFHTSPQAPPMSP